MNLFDSSLRQNPENLIMVGPIDEVAEVAVDELQINSTMLGQQNTYSHSPRYHRALSLLFPDKPNANNCFDLGSIVLDRLGQGSLKIADFCFGDGNAIDSFMWHLTKKLPNIHPELAKARIELYLFDGDDTLKIKAQRLAAISYPNSNVHISFKQRRLEEESKPDIHFDLGFLSHYQYYNLKNKNVQILINRFRECGILFHIPGPRELSTSSLNNGGRAFVQTTTIDEAVSIAF